MERRLNAVFDPEYLIFAWQDASRGKHDAPNQAKFEFYLEENLYAIAHNLNSRSFKPHELREKVIPIPKQRIAQVPSLQDKIVQHAIYDGYAYFELTKPMTDGASANMRGRGDTYAISYLKKNIRKFCNKYHKPPYILKADIHGFFKHIPHDRAEMLIDKYIGDEDVKWVMKQFLNMTSHGLPLGIEQNQQLANLYLSEMDHLLREKLHCKYTGRHMDDFWILSDSREELEYLLGWIDDYVQSIGLTLNPKTDITYRKFDYLGFTFTVTDSGKIIQRLQNAKRKTELRHLHKQVEQLKAGEITAEHLAQSYMGWRQHASRGNTRNMIIKMDERLSSMLEQTGYGMTVRKGINRKGKKKIEVIIFEQNNQGAHPRNWDLAR